MLSEDPAASPSVGASLAPASAISFGSFVAEEQAVSKAASKTFNRRVPRMTSELTMESRTRPVHHVDALGVEADPEHVAQDDAAHVHALGGHADEADAGRVQEGVDGRGTSRATIPAMSRPVALVLPMLLAVPPACSTAPVPNDPSSTPAPSVSAEARTAMRDGSSPWRRLIVPTNQREIACVLLVRAVGIRPPGSGAPYPVVRLAIERVLGPPGAAPRGALQPPAELDVASPPPSLAVGSRYLAAVLVTQMIPGMLVIDAVEVPAGMDQAIIDANHGVADCR